MGLTKSVVPLPYSDCLLTESSFKTVSPISYTDGFALRNAAKGIQKNNKRLKGSNPELTDRRHVFELVRNAWGQKKGVWFALDFECWELDHNLITEFGWSSVHWQEESPIEEQGHLIVEEARMYVNTQYVKGNRDNFNFGESQMIKNKDFIAMIHAMFSSLRNKQPVFLVFHDSTQDLKYLEKIGVDVEGVSKLIPTSTDALGLFVVDTAELMGALLGDSGGNKRGLEQTCKLLQIRTEFLHNAGNDAHYTMLALQAMVNGDQLDTQREKRWPKQTRTGVVVELEPWQEEDDYDDQEGVFGFIDQIGRR